MKSDVRLEELFQLAGFAKPPQFGSQRRELSALRRARTAGSTRRSDGFDGDPEFRRRLCSARRLDASRHRTSLGSNTFQSSGSCTTMPTRRRE